MQKMATTVATIATAVMIVCTAMTSTGDVEVIVEKADHSATTDTPPPPLRRRPCRPITDGRVRDGAWVAEIYKDRNTVERAFNRLRGYRAVATRYDKREFVYRGTVDIASIGIWLRHPPEDAPRDTA